MKVCPAFIDETGVLSAPPSRQPVYGIGLLVLPDPATVTDRFYRMHFNFASGRSNERARVKERIIADDRVPRLEELNILMRDSRHHEYKFTEVTSANVQQYIDLLNVYFSEPTFEFHALLVNRLDPRFSLKSWAGDPWAAYASFVHELLKRRLTRDVFAIVDLQGQPKVVGQQIEDALSSLPHVTGCLRASSETSVFLQITDVLLGCLQFDWRDAQQQYVAGSKRAEAKRNLSAFVKSRFGVGREEPILTPTRTFRRWRRPSVFSAWLWERSGGK